MTICAAPAKTLAMLVLISPAKTLDETPMRRHVSATQPRFLDQAEILVRSLQEKSPEALQELMGISDRLARINAARYAAFSTPLGPENAKPALFSFQGDVYRPITVEDYDATTLQAAHARLRILSGLYGLLRPLDWLYPYRLEMGTRLVNLRGTSLYAFWGTRITEAINADLQALGTSWVLNLASAEYSKAVVPQALAGTMLTVRFEEAMPKGYRTVGVHAKKARGMMVDSILREGWSQPEQLQAFTRGGYVFNAERSDARTLAFTRD